MTTPYQQQASGLMTYPSKGTFNRIFFKTPLVLWRMGLGPLMGQSILVLTTQGRKSGRARHTALSYIVHEGKVYLAPGWPERSDWYKNLQANPLVTVQLGEGYYYARTRKVTDEAEFTAVAKELLQFGDSHSKPWLKSLGIEPTLEDLRAKRDRISLLALDWSNESGPEALEQDLKWLWGVIGISYFVGWLMGRISARRN